MSIIVRHQVTGDTPRNGFHQIASTEGVGEVSLPMLHLDPDNPRIVSNNIGRVTAVTELTRVWEYESVDWGKGAILQTMSAIAPNTRPHGYTDMALLITKDGQPVSEIEGGIPALTSASARDGHFLELNDFWGKQDKNTWILKEETWEIIPRDVNNVSRWKDPVSDEWLMTLLARYWENASIRAFSDENPALFNVCFGDGTGEETIAKGKVFFTDVLIPRLPKQVQNIHSIAIGVNCLDSRALHTAMEINVRNNWIENVGMSLWDMGIGTGVNRLDETEKKLIREVMNDPDGIPDAVNELWTAYQEFMKPQAVSLNDTTFMADWRVWVGIRRLKEYADTHSAMSQTEMVKRYDIWHDLRNILEKEHKLPITTVNAMMEKTERAFFAMFAQLRDGEGHIQLEKAFLKKKPDLEFLINHILDMNDPEISDIMTELLVADQQRSANTFFGQVLQTVETGNTEQKSAFAKVLEACLPCSAILIEEDLKKGNSSPQENKRLAFLYTKKFNEKLKNTESTEVMKAFLKGQSSTLARIRYLKVWQDEYLDPEEKVQLILNLLKGDQYISQVPGTEDDITALVYENRKGLNDPQNHQVLYDYWTRLFTRYTDPESDRELKALVDKLDPDTSGVIQGLLKTNPEQLNEDRVKRIYDVFYGKCTNKQAVRDTVDETLKSLRERTDSNYFETIKKTIESLHGRDPDIYSDTWQANQRKESLRYLQQLSGQDIPGSVICEIADWTADNETREVYTDILEQKRHAKASFGDLCKYVDVVPDSVRNDEKGKNWIKDQNFRNLKYLAESYPDIGDGDLKTAGEWAAEDPNSMKVLCEILDRFREDQPTVQTFRRLCPLINDVAEKGQVASSWKTEQLRQQMEMLLRSADRQAESLERTELDKLASWTAIPEIRGDYEKMLKDVRERQTKAENNEQNEQLCRVYEWLNEAVKKVVPELPEEERKQWSLTQTGLNTDCLLKNADEKSVLGQDILQKICDYADECRTNGTRGWDISLTKYCELTLEAGETEPTEKFAKYFTRVSQCPNLEQWFFERAKKVLHDPLKIEELQNDLKLAEEKYLKKINKTQDDLYQAEETTITECVKDYFSHADSLEKLQDMGGTLQCRRLQELWRSLLLNRKEDLQGQYILACTTADELREKRNTLFGGNREGTEIEQCCTLIDTYIHGYSVLGKTGETALGQKISDTINQTNTAVENCKAYADHMRKLLETCHQPASETEDMKACPKRSFRHRCAAIVYRASVRSEQTDWDAVLGTLFPPESLKKAIKAPYKTENLPVLQTLLATDDFMENAGMEEEFRQNLSNHALLSQYVKKIRDDEKNFNLYVDGSRFQL